MKFSCQQNFFTFALYAECRQQTAKKQQADENLRCSSNYLVWNNDTPPYAHCVRFGDNYFWKHLL